jgi:hypothetical protein
VKRILLIAVINLVTAACAGPQVTRVLPLTEAADAPYDNVLVVSLFKSFDQRRYLENALVDQLTARGVNAVASTSRMNTRTPLNKATFVAMVEELGSDAVLLTQLVDLEVESTVKNMRPEATYNVRSTWYYNVWSVELTEYTEPRSVEFKNTLMLSTQMFSARSQKPVWAIETKSKITQDFDRRVGDSPIIDEAKAITRYLARDGLLARQPAGD